MEDEIPAVRSPRAAGHRQGSGSVDTPHLPGPESQLERARAGPAMCICPHCLQPVEA